MLLVLFVSSCRVFTIMEICGIFFGKFLKLFNMLESAKVIGNVTFTITVVVL